MKLTFTILIGLLIIGGVTNARSVDHWVLEFDKDGVRVYTQVDETSPYKQVKVTTTINAPADKVVEILLAFNQYKTWMNHVTESYLINQSGSDYYVFTLEDAAWPMQNRYLVSKINVDRNAESSKISFRSVPDYIEKRKDAIQIRKYEGYWTLHDRPNHQCTLEYVLIQHPGGHVPPWLANFNAAENPFHSISHLKQKAESESLRP
jgi:hypothetical protein